MAGGERFPWDVVVVGGCGHVGLPLAIALADRGMRVLVQDVSAAAVASVNAGTLPFREPGAGRPLRRALAAGRLTACADPAVVSRAEHVIVAVSGPPGAADCGPGPDGVAAVLDGCAPWLRDGQLLIVRSTLAPGGTEGAEKLVARLGLDADVAYCPERIAEGAAMTELRELPQIVASRTARGTERAARLLSALAPAIVPMTPEEAELAKLFANAWRYIGFAVANQFYMIATDLGADYERVRQGLARGYPRAAGLPPAGFAAGPCLPKDTAALARAAAGSAPVGYAPAGSAPAACPLGDAAIAINQGLPGYLVGRLARRYELARMTVGILGVAFKAGSDDARGSLSYPLAGLLAARARAVLRTDPLVTGDPGLLPLRTVLDRADLLVVAVPHPQYRDLQTGKPVADPWNVTGRGVLI